MSKTKHLPNLYFATLIVVFAVTISVLIKVSSTDSLSNKHANTLSELQSGDVEIEPRSSESTGDHAGRSLILLQGAADITRTSNTNGSVSLSYHIKATFPAERELESLATQLKRIGWGPMKEDWLNPGLPSSHSRGWMEYQDRSKTPPIIVSSWIAQWKDSAGNIVDYSISYLRPTKTDGEECQRMNVFATWHSR